MNAGAERYTLFAGAVAGRRLSVASDDKERERAYTDGETIYLAGGEPPELVPELVVQAALLAAGSFDSRTIARLTGRAKLRDRYLTLEAIRAISMLATSVPRPLERRVREVYPGAVSASREESLARVLKGREEIPEPPSWFGTIRPRRLLARTGPADDASGAGSELNRELLDDLDDEEDTDRSLIMALFSAPALRNPLGEAIQKLLGVGGSQQAEGSAGSELPVGSARSGKVGRNASRARLSPETGPGLLAAPAGRRYPEWDWRKRHYREGWCAVSEWDPDVADAEPAQDVQPDVRLRKELARLGLALERHPRQDEGDVLDVAALIDYVVERKAGGMPDPRVYETKRKTAHDLGVLVLLDASGSTSDSGGGERVFDDQRRLAGRLTAAFDELGDRSAAYAFQSWGRESVRFLRVKGFDDRYDRAAQRRLGALSPSGFTRLGAAIRHAGWLLSDRAGTGSTLLVVVGDGLPYDDGYEQRYAQEDCRRALQEAVRDGVACACVSVGTSTDERVIERAWGHVPYRRLEHPAEMSQHVTPLLRKALRQAAASRRRT